MAEEEIQGGTAITTAEYNKLKKKADILDFLLGEKEEIEETFLAKVVGAHRLTIYEPVREFLGIEVGDILRVTVQIARKAPEEGSQPVESEPLSEGEVEEPIEELVEEPTVEPVGEIASELEPELDEIEAEPEVAEEAKIIPEKELPENAKWVTCKSCSHRFSVPLDTIGYDCPECKYKFPPRPLPGTPGWQKIGEDEEKEKSALLTDQQRFDQQLIELHAKGLNDREVAEKLRVTKDTVRRRRDKLGIKAQKRARQFTDQQLTDLHAEGLSDKEVAERLGVSVPLSIYHRKRLGLEPNESKPKPEEGIVEEGQAYVEPCINALDFPLQDTEVCLEMKCDHYKRKYGKNPAECTWPEWKKIGWEDEVEEEPIAEPEGPIESEDDVILILCESGVHKPGLIPHEKRDLGDGWAMYTCLSCKKSTPMRISEVEEIEG